MPVFAQAHNKLPMLAEFETKTALGAAWLAAAQQYLIADRGETVAAFYFDFSPAAGGAYDWSLTSTADVAAFQTNANDTVFTS